MEFLQPFETGRVLSRAPAVLGQNLGAFTLMALVAHIPQTLLNHLLTAEDGGEMTLAVLAERFPAILGALLAGSLLGSLAVATVTYGVLQQLRGQHATFTECLRAGLSRGLAVMGVALVTALGVGVGCLFCLVPGIMLLTTWYVAVPATVVEKLGPIASIDRSMQLTRGFRWPVFGLIVCLGVLSFTISLLAGFVAGALSLPPVAGLVLEGALGALLTAFSSVSAAIAYHDLRVTKEGVSTDDLVQVFE